MHRVISRLALDGTWEVTYSGGGDKAIYTIVGSKVNVISCDWNKCKEINESSIIPTDDETNYPSTQGWWKVAQIHRSNIFLYVRAKDDGGMEVKYRWSSNIDSVGTGIGIKGRLS